MNRRRLIMIAGFLLITFLLVVFMNWLYGNGRLKLELPPGGKTVTITTESSEEVVSTNDDVLQRRLRSGPVTIEVSQGSSSYLSIKQTPRFLNVVTVVVELTAQNNREFVGKNPKNCSHLIGQAHLTYLCGGPVFSLSLHHPATAETPSYSDQSSNFFSTLPGDANSADPGIIEGIFNLNSRTYMLVKDSVDFGNKHSLYEISYDGSFDIRFAEFVNLDEETVYTATISNGKLELLAIDNSHILIGDDLSSMKKIVFGSASQNEGGGYSFVDYLDDSFIAASPILESSNRDFELSVTKSLLSVNRSEGVTNKETTGRVTRLEYCGERVCVLNADGGFRIYDGELNFIMKMDDISNFTVVGDDIFLLRRGAVLSLNSATLSGRYIYSSIMPAVTMSQYEGSLVLSVEGKNSLHTLFVANTTKDGPYIDQKLGNISQNPFVFDFSAYGSFIYISAETGNREFSEETGTFIKNPQVVEQASQQINALIREAGLAELGYLVTITGL